MRTSRLLALAAAAVLALSACGGGGTTGTDDAGNGGDGAATVSLMGTDALEFSPTEVTAPAGEITVELECGEGVNHDFTVEGEGGDEPVAECAAGENGTGTVSLDAGTYTFYCSVPGHREAGMEGTLTVEG